MGAHQPNTLSHLNLAGLDVVNLLMVLAFGAEEKVPATPVPGPTLAPKAHATGTKPLAIQSATATVAAPISITSMASAPEIWHERGKLETDWRRRLTLTRGPESPSQITPDVTIESGSPMRTRLHPSPVTYDDAKYPILWEWRG